MPTGIKVNGVDLDDIFKARFSTKRDDVGFLVDGVDISNRYEAATSTVQQINYDTKLYSDDPGDEDLRYLFVRKDYSYPIAVITTHPASLTVNRGATATFSVVATGLFITYQWRKNGVNISGATGASYTITNSQTTDQASYTVVVSNPGGSVTSNAATLTVIVPPSIVTHPVSLTVNQGLGATFSVTIAGSTSTYQWRKDGVNITGATGSSYTDSNAQPADEGNYSVVVTNAAGSVTSNNASLTVVRAPTIVTQPSNLIVNRGASATFTVVAAGQTPLSYQWRKDGTPINGATSSSYTITNAQAANEAGYSCTVTNSVGNITSNMASLGVNQPPAITTHPVSQTLNQGNTVTFSVVATGTVPLSYQWRKDGNNISGATGSSYSVTNIQPTNAGNYSVVVSNMAGSVTSNDASLTVRVPPTITTQPANQTVTRGNNATFTVAAAGTAPLSYQWYKGTAIITGATGTSFTVTGAVASDATTYYCKATNIVSATNSNNATLTVNDPPAISTQPNSSNPSGATILVGGSHTFSVVATGTTPISYQWRKDGVNIAGATGSSYTVSNAQKTSAGNYSCVVSNVAGSVTSNNAALIVNQPFSITLNCRLTQQAGDVWNFYATSTTSVTCRVVYRVAGSKTKDFNPATGNSTTARFYHPDQGGAGVTLYLDQLIVLNSNGSIYDTFEIRKSYYAGSFYNGWNSRVFTISDTTATAGNRVATYSQSTNKIISYGAETSFTLTLYSTKDKF